MSKTTLFLTSAVAVLALSAAPSFAQQKGTTGGAAAGAVTGAAVGGPVGAVVGGVAGAAVGHKTVDEGSHKKAVHHRKHVAKKSTTSTDH